MSIKHPTIFQNTALVLGSAAVFVFAVAFSVFAYNLYNNPVGADQTSNMEACQKSFYDLTVSINKIKLTADDQKKFDKLKQSIDVSNLSFAECDRLLSEIKSLYSRVTDASYAKSTASGATDQATGKDQKDSSSGSSQDFEFLSKQDYSATAISGLPTSKNCEANKVGQVVVVSKIKDFEPSGDKRVEVAVSTGGFYTKRGTLQKISGSYVDKLIEGYNKATGGQKIDGEFVVSGLYFPNVPVESALKVQLYSPSWGERTITITDIPKVSKACETVFVPVYENQSTDMDVCVHSKDRSKDYSPKKTFTYPKQKEEAKKFQDENKGSIVSLGPCQSAAELAKKINGESSLEQQVEEKKEMGIGYNPDPNSPSGPSKVNESGSRDSFVQDSLREVNNLRRSKGLSEIKLDQRVQKHAEDRLAYLVSQNACGTHANSQVNVQFYQNNGFSGISENVGAGSDSYSGTEAVSRYISSPDHLGNLLIPNNKLGGFAYAPGNAGGLNGYCDVQIFVQQ